MSNRKHIDVNEDHVAMGAGNGRIIPATHDILVRPKGNERLKGVIGCGWLSIRGKLNIKLNPGAVISWKDDLEITALPRDNDNPYTDYNGIPKEQDK